MSLDYQRAVLDRLEKRARELADAEDIPFEAAFTKLFDTDPSSAQT
jgi:hypothetical protein